MLIGGSKMETYIYEILPFSKENKREVLKEINMIVTSNAIGIPLLAIIQGVIAMIGYWVFNAPSPFLFGFSDLFCDYYSSCGNCFGVAASCRLHGFDRRLGKCAGFDSLCTDRYH